MECLLSYNDLIHKEVMTNEEILEVAKQHLEWEVDETEVEYFATSQHIIEFAQKIHKMGYNKGHDDGWEDRGIAESSTYPSGLVGDPQ